MNFWSKEKRRIVASASLPLVLLFAPLALQAGQITPADFSAAAVTEDYVSFPLAIFPPTRTATPTTIDGVTYDTNNGQLRYISTILANDTDLGYLDLTFSTPVLRAGVTVSAAAALVGAWTSQVSFFNEVDALLGSITVNGNNPAGVIDWQFAGWEADIGSVKRLRIEDLTANGVVQAINTLTRDSAGVPAPATIALIMVALPALSLACRRPNLK